MFIALQVIEGYRIDRPTLIGFSREYKKLNRFNNITVCESGNTPLVIALKKSMPLLQMTTTGSYFDPLRDTQTAGESSSMPAILM